VHYGRKIITEDDATMTRRTVTDSFANVFVTRDAALSLSLSCRIYNNFAPVLSAATATMT